jgi:hypothetical protein
MAKKKQKVEEVQDQQPEPQLRRVVIATPALTGEVHTLFMHSLVDSIKVCLSHGIELFPITLINESILPMARNELIALAYSGKVESMVFIDADQAWNPFALLDIINSSCDVIGIPVVDKTDEPGRFNVRIHDPVNIPVDESGNIKVTGIGTGFLKLSRPVLEALWNSNPSTKFRSKTLKLICEYSTSYNEFIGEDICLSNKIRELGFDIWVNPNFTCSHIGNKTWEGNFAHFLGFITSQSQPQDTQTEE